MRNMTHERRTTLRHLGDHLDGISLNHSQIIYGRHRNQEAEPIISEIQVSGSDGHYHVRAYLSDEYAYIRALISLNYSQTRYYNLEGVSVIDARPTIALKTNNIKLFLYFIKELIKVSPGLRTSGLQETLSNNHLNLVSAYRGINEIPTWDICRTESSSRRGTDYVCTNSSPQARIGSIIILHEDQGPAFNLTIQFTNQESVEVFKTVHRNGNQPYRTDNLWLHLHVNQRETESLNKLRLLIANLQRFEPLLSGEYLTRILQVINMGSVIGERLITSPEQTQSINTNESSQAQARIANNNNQTREREDAMEIDRSHERVNADLQSVLDQSFAEHYGHTSATYRPTQSAAPTLPEVGPNASALEGKEIAIPYHLTCKLSFEIMTDPVCFVGISNQDCFEYAWIMEHLRNNRTHPLTREPVRAEMLVSNLVVKRECDNLVKKIAGTNNNMKI